MNPRYGTQPPDPCNVITWSIRNDAGAEVEICIEARNTGHKWLKREIDAVNAIGDALGCWTCGTMARGGRDWIKDHYPPTDELPKCTHGHNDQEGWAACKAYREKHRDDHLDCARHDAIQVLMPQCHDCSLGQGGGRNKSKYTKEKK
jgi:hypothetical protein